MIIVTGGTGFIGRRLVPLLVKRYGNKKILCLIKKGDSNYEKAGRKVLDKLEVKTKFIDLDTGEGLENLPKDTTHVFHLAAKTDTSEKGHNNTNHLGTQRLLNSLNPNKNVHLIYTSTTAFMSGRKNCSKPISENDAPQPTNEYGRSKLLAEKYLLKKNKEMNFKLTIVRFPTVYGPYPRKNSFFDIIDKFVQNGSIFSRLNWPGKTSLVHVDDVANIVVKLRSGKRKTKNNTFIISSESLRFDNINKAIYLARKTPYKPIALPKMFWRAAAYLRGFIPAFEGVLPRNLYNLIWRAGLLVDNVIDCKSVNFPKEFPNYKFIKLPDSAKSLVGSIYTIKKNKQRNDIKYHFFVVTFIFFINFFFLRKILNLTFLDDDWLGILLYKSGLTNTIFNPYGFQQITFGKIYDLVGYNPVWFFSYSIILRSIAALTIYFLVFNLTTHKWSSLLSAMLFSLSYIGFETTEVSNNSNTYLSITFTLLFAMLVLKYSKAHTFRGFAAGTLLFILAIIVAPIRVYMLGLWVILLCFLLTLTNKSYFKTALVWISIAMTSMFVLVKLETFGATNTTSNSFLDNFKNSFSIIAGSISDGEQKYIRYFVTGIANQLIPDQIIGYVKRPTFPEFYLGLSFLVYLTFFTIKYFFSRHRTLKDAATLAFGFWVPIFFLVAWLVWLGREPILVSYRRYLTVPFAGFCIFTGLTVSTFMKTKLQIFFTSLFTLLTISAHAYALWDYSNLISNHRDFNLERQLLTEIKTKLPNLPQGISYFYFDDGRRHEEMYNTLYLGFSTKMAVLYEIPYPSKTIKPPHFTTSKEEILMIASTGEPLLKHGYEKKPLPQENIFAFRIDENKLKEIKEEIFTNNKN